MESKGTAGLQLLVFSLVAAAFTTIYITQPVLPVIQTEFGVDEFQASLTVSAVILGIALANLPFGMIVDRYSIRPIIISGACIVVACNLVSAVTKQFWLLVAVRFLQGLFIPSMTTCLAAFLARSLPHNRLNVVMGSYVSATVAGGLSGRLLGGWIHPPLHWRYAFISAAVFLAIAAVSALRVLPKTAQSIEKQDSESGFLSLALRKDIFPILAVSFSTFFVFSSIFNYLPFYLSSPAFGIGTRGITFLYLSYIVGIIIGPLAGKLSNRFGNGGTMAAGALVFASSIGLTFIHSIWGIACGLFGVCAGFFTVHASAAGTLNWRLTEGRGRANALYVLFYYLGGSAGITLSGYAWRLAGWPGVAVLCFGVLLIPVFIGIQETKRK
jgi:MFS transporter, YNFM family, putative membrane transport protein